MEVDIREAAVRLGVTESAVRRRLGAGTLEGRQERIASGYKWVCVLPDGAYATPTLNGDQVAGELVSFLQEQLIAKDSQNRDPAVLATSTNGTQWDPRDQVPDGGLVNSLRALL